ncbi:uncharacterized protein LOC110985049 isoform X2 [Acanthaster planci]|uniref:Uncharacterized protein LOC110985049 isoform X2 n=1 Tax=Acanthaster planci TaxID=133434 RepID=A0A8B7ZEF5_ACAPL|nr:uncharacterized protein LOC110985049 isoform X2 [Acanthaster planci]
MDSTPDTGHQLADVRLNSATTLEMETSGEIPYMDADEPAPSPPSSRSGTLKARKSSKGRSPKCSPLMVNKESSIPIVKKEAEKVMEMFLKRRSMSMNDAILQKEFFSQERRRKKDRAPRNNTVSICSTMSTDSSDYRNSGDFEEATLTRSKGSFSRALENSVLPGDVRREQSSADDELSSSDHEMDKEKSRSAPSTLRLQVGRLTEEELEKLREAGNGYAQHDKDGVKKDVKKKDLPKRRKSLLDKAKQIIRSPSMQRKHDHSEEKEAPVGPDETSASRSKVHQEMKRTGFANRLKRTFKRDSRKSSLKSCESETRTPTPPNSASSESKDGSKTRRWPSFQLKRKPRKSASTPTDDSLAGATPSDTTSNADWASVSDYDHTQSLTEFDRRKLLKEIHNGVQLRHAQQATGSDSQLHAQRAEKLPSRRSAPEPEHCGLGSTGTQTPSSVLSSSQESGMSSDWSSGGSGQRTQRPRSLNLTRSRRHERARQGLNDVFKLDRITPGHVRRDTDTRQPVMPTAQDDIDPDLETDGINDTEDDMSVDGGNEDATLQRPSKREREEFYKRIADRLAQIGDRFVTEYQEGLVGEDEQARPVSRQRAKELGASAVPMETSAAAATGSTESDDRLFDSIGGRIRDHVDGYRVRYNQRLHPFSPQSILSVVRDHTYAVFRDTMQSLIGQDTGFEQLALVFKFTKLAMKIAQHYGSRANEIKDNSLRYIGDRFAAWLDSQGGWGAVVYSSDSEEEGEQSHHGESEID